MTRVGVVVLNFNNWQATHVCVSSLRRTQLPAGYEPLHLVVVDNASDDPASDELTSKIDQLVELSQNTGYGAGNNRGLEACLSAGCEWILVLNNDTEVAPDALAKLTAAQRELRDEDPVIVAPEIRYGREPDRIWYSGGALDRRRGRVTHWGVGRRHDDFVPPSERASFVSGCAMFASASTWRALAGFEERYFLYWEDAELSVRHLDSGGSIRIVRDAVIYHDVGGGPRYRGPQRSDFYYYGSRNRLWLIRSDVDRPRRWSALLWTFSFAVRTVGYLFIHDRENVSGKIVRICAGTTSGLVRGPRGSGRAVKAAVRGPDEHRGFA